MQEPQVLIGVDDTDNETSRGTGHRARRLALSLEQAALGTMSGITRHQLLVDDAIPYTSHNSSACLALDPAAGVGIPALMDFCREFLLESAADGSDVGLCAATYDSALRVREFGRRAQLEVLRLVMAEELAEREHISLEGLTGDHMGKIGALAAVGLHSHGDDGRYLWVRGIRELDDETVSVGDLRRMTGVDLIRTMDGTIVDNEQELIQLGPWPRPVREAARATLLVERNHGTGIHWKVIDKEVLKAYRP